MKDRKDQQPKVESQSYFEKLETANPIQASQSIVAKIMQQLAKFKKSDELSKNS